MKHVIISFSETLNNEKVAEQTAHDLNIDWIRLEETRKRTLATNFFDILFSRKPKLTLDFQSIESYDFIVFMGPVWLGHPASPFRRIFDYLKVHQKQYGLVTVCGGNNACISNPKLHDYLFKRTHIEPRFIKELKIFDLMPSMDEKERNEKMFKYKMNIEEINQFTSEAKEVIEAYL